MIVVVVVRLDGYKLCVTIIVWRSIRAWCNTSDDHEFYKYRIVSHVTTYATVIMRQRMMKTFSEFWSCFERATKQWTLMFRHFDIFEISLCMFIFPFRISHLLFQPASFHLLYVVFWALFFSPPLLSLPSTSRSIIYEHRPIWNELQLASHSVEATDDGRKERNSNVLSKKQLKFQRQTANYLDEGRSEWSSMSARNGCFVFLHFIQHLCLRSNID